MERPTVVEVRKTDGPASGGRWAVFVGGEMREGGFFSQHAAEHAAREWGWNLNDGKERDERICPTCGADERSGCYCAMESKS